MCIHSRSHRHTNTCPRMNTTSQAQTRVHTHVPCTLGHRHITHEYMFPRTQTRSCVHTYVPTHVVMHMHIHPHTYDHRDTPQIHRGTYATHLQSQTHITNITTHMLRDTTCPHSCTHSYTWSHVHTHDHRCHQPNHTPGETEAQNPHLWSQTERSHSH